MNEWCKTEKSVIYLRTFRKNVFSQDVEQKSTTRSTILSQYPASLYRRWLIPQMTIAQNFVMVLPLGFFQERKPHTVSTMRTFSGVFTFNTTPRSQKVDAYFSWRFIFILRVSKPFPFLLKITTLFLYQICQYWQNNIFMDPYVWYKYNNKYTVLVILSSILIICSLFYNTPTNSKTLHCRGSVYFR